MGIFSHTLETMVAPSCTAARHAQWTYGTFPVGKTPVKRIQTPSKTLEDNVRKGNSFYKLAIECHHYKGCCF